MDINNYYTATLVLSAFTFLINGLIFQYVDTDSFHGIKHRKLIKKLSPYIAILFPLWWLFIVVCAIVLFIILIILGFENLSTRIKRRNRKRANRNRVYKN